MCVCYGCLCIHDDDDENDDTNEQFSIIYVHHSLQQQKQQHQQQGFIKWKVECKVQRKKRRKLTNSNHYLFDDTLLLLLLFKDPENSRSHFLDSFFCPFHFIQISALVVVVVFCWFHIQKKMNERKEYEMVNWWSNLPIYNNTYTHM